MLKSTMKKLGLAITHPSKYSIRIANQALITPMGRIQDLKMKIGGMDYQLNFEVLPMRGSLSTILNNEAYPLLLGRGFLRQCGGVIDWSTKKPTFTYGPLDNRTKVLIEPKIGKNGVKLKTKTASPNKLLNIAISSRPTPTSNLDSRIKCLGLGLYDFVDKDGTFADWLRENPYSDDETKDPVIKDPLCQETEKTSAQTHPSIHEITKPSTMFIEQVTIGNTTKQVAMVDEILGCKILQPKNSHISFKKHYRLKKRPKMVTSMSSRSKMATTIATKSMSDLIKEAWRAKAKIAAQKTKNNQMAKKLQQPTSSTPRILSFDDWRFKRLYERHNKTRDINSNSSEAMKRLSDDLSCNEITNPTVMFTNQMVFEDIPQQATEAEEIMAQDVFQLEIDGTQLEDWDALMEEVIIDDLPPPLHFQRTSDGIQVRYNLPIYPPVPNDWYHGPTKTIDVRSLDWKEINLACEDEEPKIIKIESQLTEDEVQQYKDLMLEFIDVFVWSYMDLKEMPPEIVQHTILLFPDTKPIRQLQRRMKPRMQLIVKVELERLLQAGFIKPVEITDWVSPMVLVKKKNGKIRICIDYRALNKRTQKDHFPLPFINIILDEVAGHELYTFMDGYSSYNQISIAPEDHHKTAFITPWGTFIYVVMPFGLYNAPSAFQRAMSFAFSNLLHKSMTVFIDDFSTHSSAAEHLYWV